MDDLFPTFWKIVLMLQGREPITHWYGVIFSKNDCITVIPIGDTAVRDV